MHVASAGRLCLQKTGLQTYSNFMHTFLTKVVPGHFHGNRRTIQTKFSKFKEVLLEKLSLVTLFIITNASIEELPTISPTFGSYVLDSNEIYILMRTVTEGHKNGHGF